MHSQKNIKLRNSIFLRMRCFTLLEAAIVSPPRKEMNYVLIYMSTTLHSITSLNLQLLAKCDIYNFQLKGGDNTP